jgi:hypothetical protein
MVAANTAANNQALSVSPRGGPAAHMPPATATTGNQRSTQAAASREESFKMTLRW